jgi:AraC-like DNA-binding protein
MQIQEAEQYADEVEQGWLTEETGNEVAVDSDRTADDEMKQMSEESIRAIDEAIGKWIERGGYLHLELKLPLAAEDIGIRRHRLTNWLRLKGKKYTEWIADLRIEEAKRLIKEHPDWSSGAIARHCGYTDRSFFRTFKKLTGMTPMQFAEQESSKV